MKLLYNVIARAPSYKPEQAQNHDTKQALEQQKETEITIVFYDPCFFDNIF